MTGDEKTNDDLKPSDVQARPAIPAPKSVFSDDFDDPENGRDPDELPEDEPLTPELVEEEAIRGDFMLRWAAVFLAVLMAFGQINDTRPLVLIRSGDQMRANGFLPARVDQFSMTMDRQPVTNVSWLFDHLISLSWALGGEAGLTLLKVLIAGFSAAILVRISIPGVSTWWSSICAVFVIVACSSDFMPIPELITILGMTLTMRLLAQHRLGNSHALFWKLPLLIAIWCNFDSRAWVGALTIALYATGNGLTRRGLIRNGESSSRIPAPLMLGAVLSVLALLANPFPLNSLLSLIATYSAEYPAMQAQRSLTSSLASTAFDNRVDYFSILNPDAIVLFDHSHVAGISILVVAFIVVMLSFGAEQRTSDSTSLLRRSFLRYVFILVSVFTGKSTREAGFLFVLMGMAGLSILAAHELPAAAIAGGVIAGISAQEWYRRSFRMKYSTDSRELLFSRGGRAATVLGLAMIGFCVVASRLPGAMPLGLGFDKETIITRDTFTEQLKDLPEDARVLHTRIEQGDLLIWNGRKSFIDSRVLPFGRRGDPGSVAGKHWNVLETLLLRAPDEPEPTSSDPQEKERLQKELADKFAAANATLDEFGVSHIIVRLAPPGRPDFVSVRHLSGSGGWIPISIGPSAAIMERLTPTTSREQAEQKIVNFPRMAFQTDHIDAPGLRQFAAPRSFYEKYVYRQRPSTNANKRMASHYLELSVIQPQSMIQAQSALATLTMAIRHLNLSLSESPEDAEAFQMLGQTYANLGSIEQMLAGNNGGERLAQVRYQQSVSAFRQGIVIDPSVKGNWAGLTQVYSQRNRMDVALEAMTKWLDLEEQSPSGSGEEYEESLTQRFLQKRELEEQITKSDEQLEELLKKQSEAIRERSSAQKSAVPGDEAQKPEEAAREESAELLLAAIAMNSAGRPAMALKTMKEKVEIAHDNPLGNLLLAQLLLEVGELEEGHRMLALLSQEALKQPEAFLGIEWQLPTAISQLSIGDYPSAAETWGSQLSTTTMQTSISEASELYSGILYTLPLVADVNMAVNEVLPAWPLRHSFLTVDAVQKTNELRSEVSLLLALSSLEEGNVEQAKKSISRILFDYGETRVGALAAVYYLMMDEQAAQQLDERRTNLWEEFEFPGEKLPEPAAQPGQPPVETPAGSSVPRLIPSGQN